MQATNIHEIGEQRPGVSPGPENARQFDEVLSRCLPSFRRMAFRKLGNAADAEDAVQDALLSAYRHLDQFQGGAQLSTWLTTIVINSARMQLRKRSRHVQVSLDEPLGDEQQNFVSERIADDSPSPEERYRESELHDHVRQLLTQLSTPLRRAFQLRDLDGLTTQEAALILGIPTGTVKAQLTRARMKLRQRIRPSPDAKPSPAPLRTPVPVVTIQAKSSLTHVMSTAQDQDGIALPRRRPSRAPIPVSLEASRGVA
jgi:RNA polymerase sigma factor (sigma-70 family)